MRTFLIPALFLATAAVTSSCATYRDDLNRAERHFQANEYEASLALFRVLEPDLSSLSYEDRARYAYLRGINDYRLGKPYRADARHWLALAQALEQERPGVLQDSWKGEAQQALQDLNQDIYGTGVTGTPHNTEQAPASDTVDTSSDKSEEESSANKSQ